MFCMKSFITLPKFHVKTLSRPGFMDEVLCEERQLMKWVGIFQVGIFWVGVFQGKVWGVGIFRVDFSRTDTNHFYQLERKSWNKKKYRSFQRRAAVLAKNGERYCYNLEISLEQYFNVGLYKISDRKT